MTNEMMNWRRLENDAKAHNTRKNTVSKANTET